MEIQYDEMMEQMIIDKLSKLTQTLVFSTFNRISIENNRAVSNAFRDQFGQNVEMAKPTRIEPLYKPELEAAFNEDFSQRAQTFADKYQVNQIKSLINKKLKYVFDQQFKDNFKAVLYQIAQETMQQMPL